MNYFIHLLERLKLKGARPKVFIDAGAHFGETNVTMRSVFPNSRVISFEANPNCEQALMKNGAEYFICLLGKENKEEAKFYVNPDDPVSTGCSIFKEKSVHFSSGDSIEVPMFRLDSIIPDELSPDFLKMDVQGAELDILDGMGNSLKSVRWIYLEVSFVSLNEGSPLFADVFSYLTMKGYSIVDMCDPTYVNDELVQCNFLFENGQLVR